MRAHIRDVPGFEQAIRALVESLRAAGAEDDANVIASLLSSAWTTGSEYYAELGDALVPMRRAHRGDLRRAIKSCHHFAVHHRRILKMD